MVEYGEIEWQGSLRATYDKYLHPDAIDLDDENLWSKLYQHELLAPFQFDTPISEQTLQMVKPTNIVETTTANTLMRLMKQDGMEYSPLEMYCRQRDDISIWYDDMRDNWNLNEDEIKVMERHLLRDCGVCNTQEQVMMMVMDKDIANFNVPQSNIVRKSISKRDEEAAQKAKDLLYELGEGVGTRKQLLDYVWFQISLSRGYAFSVLHSYAYTTILGQQLHLITKYPSIYYNTAYLLVETSATSNENAKQKTIEYGGLGASLSQLQQNKVTVQAPHINKSRLGFAPNKEDNTILFGLKGITGVNNDVAKHIIDNRPYTSVQDFYERLVLTKRQVTLSTGKTQMKSYVSEGQFLTLIKAGAFDEIENKTTEQILTKHIETVNKPKTKVDDKFIGRVIDSGIVPSEFNDLVRIYNYHQFLKTMPTCEVDRKFITLACDDVELEEDATDFFYEHYEDHLIVDRDYYMCDNGSISIDIKTGRKEAYSKTYARHIAPLKEWISSEECLSMYVDMMLEEVKSKKMSGDKSKWRMETLNCYVDCPHEVEKIDNERYGIVSFHDLDRTPMVVGTTRMKNRDTGEVREYNKYELSRICGVVLDFNKNTHTIVLLTPTGTVNVKMNGGNFSFYNKTISYINDEGKRVVVEEPWTKRHNILMVHGFRRDDQFFAKKYADSMYTHTIYKVTSMLEDGSARWQTERIKLS